MLVINEKTNGIKYNAATNMFEYSGDIFVDDALSIELPGNFIIRGRLAACGDLEVHCYGLVADYIYARGHIDTYGKIQTVAGPVRAEGGITARSSILAATNVTAAHGAIEVNQNLIAGNYIESGDGLKVGGALTASCVHAAAMIRVDASADVANVLEADGDIILGQCNVRGKINASGNVVVLRGKIDCPVRAASVAALSL